MSASERAVCELQCRFAAAIRAPDEVSAPEGVPARRMAVYQDLFFNTIQSGLASVFPVARKLLTDSDWRALVRGFLREHRSQTPEYPRMSGEFLQWLEGTPSLFAAHPPWLFELLVWEHAELVAMLAPDDTALPRGDLLVEQPVLTTSLQLHAFAWPVHRVSPNFIPEAGEVTFLACFRTPQDQIDFLELTPASAVLLESLQAGTGVSGAQQIQQLAAVLGVEQDAVSGFATTFLQELSQRHVIVGTRPIDEAKK